MKKRLWAVILAAAVAFTSVEAMPYTDVQPAAAATTKPSNKVTAEVIDTSTDGKITANGYTFSISGGEATITGYNGTAKELSIPTKISVSQTATSTTQGAVKATSNKKPTTPEVPTTDYMVTAIGNNAFGSRLGIRTVTMINGKNSDGKDFGIKKIGEGAFFACHDLTSVTLAASTSTIEVNAFADCIALTSIKVADGNPKYKVLDGALYSYSTATGTGAYKLEQYPIGNKTAEYKVPELLGFTLTEIGQGAFWGAQNIETITLPNTVTNIDHRAFAECKKLKKVTLPEGLTSIASEAFKGDIAIEEMKIPAGVTIINQGTFQGCEAMKSVELPEKLTVIAANAFQGCKALATVVVPTGVTTIGDQAFAQCSGLQEITIPTKTTAIGASALAGTKATVFCNNNSRAAAYAKANGLSVERTFTVNFYTNNTYTTLISSQEVSEGKDAEPPKYEALEGYETEWSADYKGVTQDLMLYPVQNKIYEVKFVDSYNGKEESVKVADGKAPTPPSWSMSGYSLRWEPELPTEVHSDMTITTVWSSESNGQVIDPDAVRPEDVGTELTSGNNRYVVSSSNVSHPTVKFVGVVEAKTKKVKIPASISSGDVTYKVTSIGTNAASGNGNITSVEINKNVKSINGKAFQKCTKLKKVRIKAKSISKIGKKAFDSVHKKVKFYTFNSKLSKYKSMLKKAGMKKPIVKRL